MDVLPRITRQLFELFRAMSPVQRATFVMVPVLMVGGFIWLLAANRPSDLQPVSFGKAFATDELTAVEKALNQAGLTEYRRSGRQILAPAGKLDRYNAALVEFDAVPSDLGSQILKQFESLGPFSTDKHRQEMKDALLLQELRRMIKAVPDIEDAWVTIANSGRRVTFGQKPRVTANVTVKPRAGRELTPRLVGSFRQAVASMVPDLLPADVTVFDVVRGQAFSGEQSDDPADSQLIQRVREFTRQYEQQIQKALSFIPNATVVVHVDIDNLKSSVTRNERLRVTSNEFGFPDGPEPIQQIAHSGEPLPHESGFRGTDFTPRDLSREVSETQLLAAMPRAVQVSVSIPRDYYRDVAALRKAQGEQRSARLSLDSIEEEILAKVERTVARLIPIGSPRNAVSVTTVDRLPVETSEPTLTPTEQFTILAQRHGGSVALGLFVVWALWMLMRLNAAPAPALPSPSLPTAPIPTAPIPSSSLPNPALEPIVETPRGASVPETPSTEPPAESIPERVSEPAPSSAILQQDEMRRADAAAAMKQATPSQTPIGDGVAPFRESVESAFDSQSFDTGPFAFLNGRHPDDIRPLLTEEHAQTIAVVAAQLRPSLSAAVLAGFAPDRQADVLQRVATLGPTDPEILSDIAAAMKERLGRPRVQAGGISRAASLLRESPRATTRSMLAALENRNVELADELRQTLFSFDDLLKLDNDTLRVILEETDDRQWAIALKASPVTVRQKVLGCLPERVAAAVQREMDSLGPVRLSEMTAVREQIADSIRRMEDDGRIVLPFT
jgi:flagellar M-ring protein FliF